LFIIYSFTDFSLKIMALNQDSLAFLSIAYSEGANSATSIVQWQQPPLSSVSWYDAVRGWATTPTAQQQIYPYLAAPGVASAEQYVLSIYRNLFGSAPSAADLKYWTDFLTNDPFGSYDGSGIPNYQQLPVAIYVYANKTELAALNNRIAVSNNFTQQLANAGSTTLSAEQVAESWSIISSVTSDPATVDTAKASTTQFIANGGGNSGSTFVFTTGIDALPGTSGNDTYVGDAKTISTADRANGAAGNDTFQYFSPATNTLPQLNSIENVQLLAIAPATTLDFTGVSDVKNVVIIGGNPNASTIRGLSGIVFGVKNVLGDPDIGIDFGTATAATVSIDSSVIGTLQDLKDTVTSLEIVSTGIGNSIAGFDGNALKTLTISGKGSLTITDPLQNSVVTVDASKNTGGVNLTAGNSNLTFTGSIGDDTLSFKAAGFDNKDVLDGGTGKNTLNLADGDTTAIATGLNAVKNFQTLSLGGANAKIDLSKVTPFSGVTFSGGGNIVVTQASSTNTFTINANAASFSLTNATGKTDSTLTLEGTAINPGNISLGVVKTLNLTSTATTPDQANPNLATFAANEDGTKIVVSGNQALNITGLKSTVATGPIIDASVFTGKLFADGTTQNDTLTGGKGQNTLNGLAGADTLLGGDLADTLSGGADADNLTGGKGADNLDGGAGIDIFVFAGAVDSNAGTTTGNVTFDNITGFEVANDILKSSIFTAGNLVNQNLIQNAVNAANTTLQTSLTAASGVIGASKYGAFQFGGDTYVLGNNTDAAVVDANDFLVKLTGAFTLTPTNFTV
jgi:hypothetical protein